VRALPSTRPRVLRAALTRWTTPQAKRGQRSLNIPELAVGLGTDAPAHFKPNYMDITIDRGGLITFKSVPDFVRTDRMLVYVYDGRGRFCTVEITFIVTAP
jgi:hypothetical protein